LTITETTINQLIPSTIKEGDLLALTYYVKVKACRADGTDLLVHDIDNDIGNITVSGDKLIASASSADFVGSTEKITKTAAAELLTTSYGRPFTVTFEKADGSERTLRGRLVKPEPLLGRSMVEDLDIGGAKGRLRQVDHRTIKSLVLEGVKYLVKD
jgi:hypothetical protein